MPKVPGQCFAHRHMTFAQYGLYSHLREVSHKSSYRYRFDDRTLAERFASGYGVSKDACNRLRNQLATLGFIEWLEPRQRSASGTFTARLGRILSHAEWAERYPRKCVSSRAPETGTCIGDETGTSLKLPSHQSQTRPSPVSPARHKYSSTTRSIETSGIVPPRPPNPTPNPKSRTVADNSPTLIPVAPALQVNSPVAHAIQAQSASLDCDAGTLSPLFYGVEYRDGIPFINGEQASPTVAALIQARENPS